MYKKKQFLPPKLYIPASERVLGSSGVEGEQGGEGVCPSADRSHGHTRVASRPQDALGILQGKASSGHRTKNMLLIPRGDKCLKVHSGSTGVDKKCRCLSIFQVLI